MSATYEYRHLALSLTSAAAYQYLLDCYEACRYTAYPAQTGVVVLVERGDSNCTQMKDGVERLARNGRISAMGTSRAIIHEVYGRMQAVNDGCLQIVPKDYDGEDGRRTSSTPEDYMRVYRKAIDSAKPFQEFHNAMVSVEFKPTVIESFKNHPVLVDAKNEGRLVEFVRYGIPMLRFVLRSAGVDQEIDFLFVTTVLTTDRQAHIEAGPNCDYYIRSILDRYQPYVYRPTKKTSTKQTALFA